MAAEDFMLAANSSLRDALRMQKEIRKTLGGLAGVQEALRAHREIQDAIFGPLRAVMRAHEEAQRLVYGPIREALRAHQEIQNAIYGPLRDAMRAHQDAQRLVFGPLHDAMRAHQEIQAAVFGPIREAMQAQQAFQRTVMDMAAMSKMVAGLSGVASQILKVPRVEINEAIALALKEVEAAPAAPAKKTWEGFQDGEHIEERRALKEELAKRVDDFDSLPPSSQVVELLDVVATNPSSGVGQFAFNVAGNILGTILCEADPQKILARALWLLMFMIFGWVSQLSVKLRVPKTRKILRRLQIDQKESRIVTGTILIGDLPRSRCTKIGWLTVGAVVTVVDKRKGWRQIYYTDAGQDRLGWVRSKYLRKV